MTRVIGLYDDPERARQVINQLAQRGIGEDEVELIAKDEEDLEGHIGELGVDQDEVWIFAKAVRHGKAMLSAHTDDEHADEIVQLLDKNGALDPDQLSQQFQQEEQQGSEKKETIRRVEESLSVGKRKVLLGGKRISSKVREQPVEKRVTLRQEGIDVEEHPSDRTLSPEEAEAAFKDETREFTETREIPEVKKEARESGRVEVTRSASEREETVKETVRKKEVGTEDIKPEKDRQ